MASPLITLDLMPQRCLGNRMPRIKLTDAAIKKLKPPSKQTDYWDRDQPGFALRLTPHGVRSFVCQPRVLVAGRWVTKRITLGTYPALTLKKAREKARATFEAAHDGKDPTTLLKSHRASLEEASRNSFSVLAEDFLKRYVAIRRAEGKMAEGTEKDYRRILQGGPIGGCVTAEWHNLPITEITRLDVRRLVGEIAKTRPTAANNTLAYLGKFFSWCLKQGVIQVAPTTGEDRPAPKIRRKRTLSPPELVEVWKAFEAEGGVYGQIGKLLILTGQRRDEIADTRWNELRNIETPDASLELSEERTKNGVAHSVPLTTQAVNIVKGTPQTGPHVFSTNGKTPFSGFSKCKSRIDTKIAEARSKAGVEEFMEPWTLHDIRRTVVTHMNEIGVLPHVVEAVVNHTSGSKRGVAGTYNWASYSKEKRAALQAWADYVYGLIEPPITK